MKQLLKRLTFLVFLTIFTTALIISCGKQTAKEEQPAADSTEHPTDSTEHPSDSTEHPSEHPEHPKDSTQN